MLSFIRNKIDPESIYLSSPRFIQNLLVSLEGWRIKQRRYNTAFFNKLISIMEDVYLSKEEMRHRQGKKLFEFFRKANEAPFWKKRFSEYGIDFKGDVFDAFEKLPVLTKDTVKQHVSEIAVPGFAKNDLITAHTSGTTGSGMVFPVLRSGEHTQWATWWRYRHWHGITPQTWCGYFGGRSLVPLDQLKPPFWRINRPGRQIMFSAYHLSADTAKHYVNALKFYSVPWLHGYPSTLTFLAGLKIDQKLLALPQLRIITTGAENLLPQQKSLIEKAFKVPVREHYGQAEGVANISECPEDRLHVDEDFSYVEFIPVKGGNNVFHIVGTNWSNPAFPLIRYDTGDLVMISSESCHCGMAGRVVTHIDGRKEDYVELPTGAKVGRLDHIFKDFTTIYAAQIYQPELKRIVLRVVRGNDYHQARDESLLLAAARKRLGEDIAIEVKYLEELPKTLAGKMRFVISDLSENKIG